MDDQQDVVLQKQMEHWQRRFRDEEQHNRELQQQLSAAMEDRRHLSIDLRVKNILIEDMSKELEKITICLSECKCRETSRESSEHLLTNQISSCTADELGPCTFDRALTPKADDMLLQRTQDKMAKEGRFASLDDGMKGAEVRLQEALRMLIVERDIHWLLKKDVEAQKKQLDDQKAIIRELRSEISTLTSTKSKLMKDAAEDKKLSQVQATNLCKQVEIIKELQYKQKETNRCKQSLDDRLKNTIAKLEQTKQDNTALTTEVLKLKDGCKVQEINLCKQVEIMKELEYKLQETNRCKQSLDDHLKNTIAKLEETKQDNTALTTEVLKLKNGCKMRDSKLNKEIEMTRKMQAKLMESNSLKQSLEDRLKNITTKLEEQQVKHDRKIVIASQVEAKLKENNESLLTRLMDTDSKLERVWQEKVMFPVQLNNPYYERQQVRRVNQSLRVQLDELQAKKREEIMQKTQRIKNIHFYYRVALFLVVLYCCLFAK